MVGLITIVYRARRKANKGRCAIESHAPVPPSPTSTSLNDGTPSGVVCPGRACAMYSKIYYHYNEIN